MTRATLVALAILVVGMTAAAVLAVARSMSAGDAGELIAVAGGVALGALLVAVPALVALRRRASVVQVVVLTLAVVAAIALGTYVAAEAMFISQHDLAVVQVVLLAAGAVGVAGAVVLGAWFSAGSASLVATTRRIGNVGEDDVAAPVQGPAELVRLHEALAEMEARLVASQQRERAMETSRRELVAWVSHDLRTPLAALRAMVEAVEDRVVDDPATIARYHASMREETDRLSALIDDLFELSRAQAGVVQLQMERVGLGDLVSDALAGVATVAAAKGVRLDGRVDGPGPAIQASTPELLRALRNVLENAIRHTPPDGSVMVEAGALADDRAYISVLDSGGGVPEADLERVFEVAYQADPGRRDSGAGLGLAIARGFVEAHHGRISVRNEGTGARFTVQLPCAPVS